MTLGFDCLFIRLVVKQEHRKKIIFSSNRSKNIHDLLIIALSVSYFPPSLTYYNTNIKAILLSFSALKYSTAVPVILLSALKYHVYPDSWTNFYRPLWLLSSVINSLYSFYWDVKRDWDLRYVKKKVNSDCF